MIGIPAVIKAIQKVVPNHAIIIDQCAEEGCRAVNPSFPHIIIKGESLAATGEKAVDCVFFIDKERSLFIALVELKRRSYHINDVCEKLANSERHAKAIAGAAGIRKARIQRAVFCTGGHPRVNTAEYVILAKRTGAVLKRCGSAVDALIG